ncbi:hypothetical protein EPICR_100074 [Candidatus Desulfarcum epimagneticum]|uniref:Carrier domain-containing protein n=1 Tax=uncultured Desulfobacteraceae bacterium TaxID=218296 RepID=A0A484HF12_9BACT|nr:hypothetical protein EPICR_100074 [uncultured Desulfobacteraceae bacterium]
MPPMRKLIHELTPEKRAFLAAKAGEKSKKRRSEIVREPHGENIPLSFSQTRLWFLDRLDPGLPLYNIPISHRIKGPLDINALEKSLDHILARHKSLRAVFTDFNGTPTARVLPMGPNSKLETIDLGGVPDQKREAKAHDILRNEAKKPFDLGWGPLFRTLLLKISNSEHILFFNIHHIVFDGWSAGILARELSACYDAYSNGDIPRLNELPVQYADFALWQRGRLKGEIFQTQLSYWKKKLKDAPSFLELPADFPRPPAQTHEGALEVFALPGELSRDLKNLSQREEASLFMTLLTAFNVLLSRYTGQTDILVGSPIAGRNQKEIENVMGFFVNTLVLRSDLAGNPTFLELLAKTKETCLEAYENQDIPFEKLVEELDPERDLSRPPFFSLFFNMLNVDGFTLKFSGLETKRTEISDIRSKFDMTLYSIEKEDKIHFRLVYDKDIFSRHRIICLLEQFNYLLKQIAGRPGIKINNLSFVSPDEKSILPNPCALIPEPHQEPVTEMFLHWANKTPDQVAISQGGKRWTYKQLADFSGDIAKTLINDGLERGMVTAVYGKPCFALFASIIGVMTGGGTLLTIDSDLPDKRKQYLLEAASAKKLVCMEKTAAKETWLRNIPGIKTIVVDWNSGKPLNEKKKKVTKTPAPSPNDPAYIFFTSGTTGVPNGVMNPHKSLGHFINWQRKTFDVQPSDRVSQLTSISFEPVLRDIFLPLTSGGTLCVPEHAGPMTGKKVLSWLKNERVTILHTVPSLAQFWLSDIPEKPPGNNLRYLFLVGEPLTGELAHQWRSSFQRKCEIVNFYGTTEMPQAKCFHKIPKNMPPGVQSIGRSLPESQALILTKNKKLCGVGEYGEIVLRSPFRSFGYIGAPPNHRKTFIRNPYTNDESDLLYCTGDMGRYRPDGSIDISGRTDDQIKIRGVRVEPEEVMRVLSSHKHIKSCFVGAIKNKSGEKILTAYIVGDKSKIDTSVIRSYLSERLPPVMRPSVFMFIDTIPLTSNGKVDRKALPEPDMSRPDGEKTFQAPRSPLEKTLAEVWSKVLKIEKIGIHDNFFDLGGHSLLGVRLVAEIEKATGKPLPIKALFKFSTVADMAQAIESGGASSDDSAGRYLETESRGLSKEQYRKMLTLIAGIESPAAKPGSIVTRINDGDLNPPLFWCEPGSSHPDFIKYMNRRQPIYGLYSGFGILYPHPKDWKPGNEWAHKIPLIVKRLARSCADEMLEWSPKGDFVLGGACGGAKVAAEIAFCLLEMGKKVQRLFLVEFFDPCLLDYPGKMTLFFSKKSHLKIHETFGWPNPGWEKPFRKVPQVQWIPGDHYETLIEPNLKVVSKEIRKFLREQTLPENKRPMRAPFISRSMKAVSKGSGAWLFLKIIAKCVKSPLAMVSSLSVGNLVTLLKAMQAEDPKHIENNIETYLHKRKHGSAGSPENAGEGKKFKCPVCKETRVFNPLPEYYRERWEKYGCSHSPDLFETIHEDHYACSGCGASDRERLYALYMRKRGLKPKDKLAHFAPEPALLNYVKKNFKLQEHKTADLMMEDVDDHFDLCHECPYPDNHFDAFICSHILEHVSDDAKAMKELFRILKPGGWGICMAPIHLGLDDIYENPDITDEAGRWRHFGQDDHVRIYSKQGFIKRLENSGFTVRQYGQKYFGKDLFHETGITPRSTLYVVEKNPPADGSRDGIKTIES